MGCNGGYYCSWCGMYVHNGTYHSCNVTPITYPNYNYNYYCVCCQQFQKLSESITNIEELIKKLEEKK